MKKFVLMMIGVLMLFSSCVKHSFEIYEGTYEDSQYSANFERMIGGPVNPAQTWGFSTSAMRTRGAFVNANQYDEWDCVPNVDLTDEELAELLELLSPGHETYNTEIFPHEDYWVQQVYTGTSTYYANDNNGDQTNTSVLGSSQMNHLQAWDGSQEVWWPEHTFGGYTHINNFNSGSNATVGGTCGCGIAHEGTTLMQGMSTAGVTPTTQWGFDDSWGTENGKFYNNYIIVEYKGYYYVGFDFEAHKATDTHNAGEAMQVERDWCFTDWVVRITPAYRAGTTPDADPSIISAVRVMGEDLGTTDDFDFNDIVIDIVIKSDHRAYCTLQAAGGTMPIYIGKSNDFEVHELFGVPTSTMVNTGVGATREPVSFVLDGYTDPKDVEIRVAKLNFIYVLQATVGAAPQKFACPIGTRWMKERQNIVIGYPSFSSWATSLQPDNWYDDFNELVLY